MTWDNEGPTYYELMRERRRAKKTKRRGLTKQRPRERNTETDREPSNHESTRRKQNYDTAIAEEFTEKYYKLATWFKCMPAVQEAIRARVPSTVHCGTRTMAAVLLQFLIDLQGSERLREDIYEKQDGWIFVKQSWIETMLGMSRDTQQTVLNLLIDAGFIRVHKSKQRWVALELKTIFHATQESVSRLDAKREAYKRTARYLVK